MQKNRLEAFSDGVIAIIITIMVLELRPPEGVRSGRAEIGSLPAVFFSYVLEFRLRRHLLEQPSSHAPCHEEGERRDSLGESASVVLAVAVSVHDGVDGETGNGIASAASADGGLWFRAADGGDGLLYFAMRHYSQRRSACDACGGDWVGLEGETFARAIFRGDSVRVRESVDFKRPSYFRRADMVGAGYPD